MLSLVAMGMAAEILLPGTWPAQQLNGVDGPGWLALRGDRLEPIHITLLPVENGLQTVVPVDVVALFRGEPLVAGPIRTFAVRPELGSSLKVGELQLVPEGERILVSDGERKQRLELGPELQLLWAGDLDQDGRTDLIFASKGRPSLWLSSGTPYLLRLVAGFEETGC